MPLGSLIELFRPPTLPGPRGMPLTPASPAPCARACIGTIELNIARTISADLPNIVYPLGNSPPRIVASLNAYWNPAISQDRALSPRRVFALSQPAASTV